MAKKTAHVSETPATQFLRRAGVDFTEHVYDYVEHGGTAESARQLGVDEHAVVKTLVMQDERGAAADRADARRPAGQHQEPGARDRRQVGRAVHAGGGAAAQRLPGRRHLAVRHAEGDAGLRRGDACSRSPRICINGGRRGYLVGIAPRVLIELLGATAVTARCERARPAMNGPCYGQRRRRRRLGEKARAHAPLSITRRAPLRRMLRRVGACASSGRPRAPDRSIGARRHSHGRAARDRELARRSEADAGSHRGPRSARSLCEACGTRSRIRWNSRRARVGARSVRTASATRSASRVSEGSAGRRRAAMSRGVVVRTRRRRGRRRIGAAPLRRPP